MMRRLPLALVVLPLLTLLSLAFSILLPADGDGLVHARVWGGPPVGPVSVRVQVQEEISGLIRGLEGARITVLAAGPLGAATRDLVTAEGGVVETLLPLPPGDPVTIEVRRAASWDAPLARGTITWARAAWRASAPRAAGLRELRAPPELPVDVRFEPPLLSVPFSADAILELAPSSREPVEVRVEVAGARLLSKGSVRLAPKLPVRLTLVPEEHAATLTLVKTEGARDVRRSIALPIVPGSLTARGGEGDLIIESPVPRSHAYYSVVTANGRLGGGLVDLGPRAGGTAAGRLARGDLPPGADRYLVLSSSADGQSEALVGLPLDGQEVAWRRGDVLLLDGRPAALARARARAARLRLVLFSYASAGATLFLVLFVWHMRRANERLRTQLTAVGAPPEVRDRSLFGPVSAFLSLVFAFGLALTWILVR